MRSQAAGCWAGTELYSNYEKTRTSWEKNEKKIKSTNRKIKNAETNYKNALALEKKVEPIKNDVQNFDIKNTSEQKVLNANIVSAYRGAIAVKLPIGTDSLSFGIMIIGDEVGKREDSIETIKHEWGHTEQYKDLDFCGYAI